MGNASSSGADNDPASPSSPSGSRSSAAATERTHSLPLGHRQHQLRNRHNQSPHYYHGHSDRRHMTASVTVSPNAARRQSSRFRHALPNFVCNVSAAIGHKLPWSGGAGGGSHKRRINKSLPSNVAGNYSSQYSVSGGGKNEKRSRSKTREHCRLFRELVTNWRLSDLHCLVVEFEAALSLRELRRRADAARPSAASLKDDFARLFHQINGASQQGRGGDDSSADAFLLLDGRTFAVHRAFLSRRCSFFRRLFRSSNSADESSSSANFSHYNGGWRPTIPVTFPSSITPLNASTFALLLEYLYTGELASSDTKDDDYLALIRFNDEQRQLRREGSGRCGDEDRKWTTVEDDVGAMLKDTNDSNCGADALLIFTNSKATSLSASTRGLSEAEFESFEETPMTLEDDPRSKRVPLLVVVDKQKSKCCQFKCHSAVLAARSPFFRAIIRKRRLQNEQQQIQEQQHHRQSHRRSISSPFSPWKRPLTPTSSSGLLEIVLDESVIPRQYAPVLLHAMYTDEVDLSLVMRDCVASAASCLTEVQAIAAGKCQLSPVDEATEIYQIARFIEFDKLAQGCEDVIVSYITLDSLAAIYGWSMESHGSAFVRRHCVDFLCQEFSRFCTTPLLFDADESLLVEALKSDYVQASELEILSAVIRWGEHQLVRRIEEREPNILVGTTHSISRKGVKRADLSDEELKEILADLLPLIRVDYILPPNHTVLENAIFRGLISIPSVDLLSGSRMPGVLLPPVVVARRHRKRNGGSHRHSPSALVRSCSSSASPSADDGDISIGAADSEYKARDHWSHPHRRSAGPRLFLPYLEESRALLEKRVAESPDQLSSLINHHPPVEMVSDRHFMLQRSNSSTAPSQFPDTLYMVDGVVESGACCTSEDMDTSEITMPPSSTLIALKERVDRILRTSATVRRALACGCSYHRSNVLKQVRQRAIREFGLLDSTLTVLDGYGCLASPSSMDFERPSFCSSAPLSPIDVSEGLQFVDGDLSELDVSGRYSSLPSPTKRRFRSQPELSQCDLTGCASACMDWPDLMASSLAPATSMDGDYAPLTHDRRAASFLSSTAVGWPAVVAASPESTQSASPYAAAASVEEKRDENSNKEQLRQQFVNLTQQICDLVVDGERNVNSKNEKENQEQSSPSSSVSSTSSARRHQNTAV